MLRGQQQITGANAHAQARANLGPNQRRFQLDSAVSQLASRQFASHGPAVFVQRQHSSGEDVFES